MFKLTVKVRDSPGDSIGLDSLNATQNTTFFEVRESIAKTLNVVPAAIAVFANSIEVADYKASLGTDFSKDGLISYERRVSKRNAPSNYHEAAAVESKFVSCRCGSQGSPDSKLLPLNCGCLVCHSCAENATAECGGTNCETICPYHLSPTPNNVVFPKLGENAGKNGVPSGQAEPFTFSRHEGPHKKLSALVETQQCQRPNIVNGVMHKCSNFGTYRCKECDAAPMCLPCASAHRATQPMGEIDHAIHEAPLSVQQNVYVCKKHKCSPLKSFSAKSKLIFCCHCVSVKDFLLAEDILEPQHAKRSDAEAAKIWHGLTATLRRLDVAKAAALKQYKALIANELENLVLLEKNYDKVVNDVTAQFDLAIDQLQRIIVALKSDCKQVVNAARGVTKKFETEFSRKMRKQQEHVKEYVATAESLANATREHLAAVLNTARFAPAIIPAANTLIDFAQKFTASAPTSIATQEFIACTSQYKPVVRMDVSTCKWRPSEVTYLSQADDLVSQLYGRKILQNRAQKLYWLPGLSQTEIDATKEIQGKRRNAMRAKAAAKAKADADAATAAVAAAKVKADADAATAAVAAAKVKADADAAVAAAKAKADADAAAAVAAAKVKADADAAAAVKAKADAAAAAAVKAKADAAAAAAVKAKADADAAAAVAAAKVKADADAAAKAKADADPVAVKAKADAAAVVARTMTAVVAVAAANARAAAAATAAKLKADADAGAAAAAAKVTVNAVGTNAT